MLSSLVHQLSSDFILRLAGKAFAKAKSSPAGHAAGEPGELRVASYASPFDVRHQTIIHDSAEYPATNWQHLFSTLAIRVP
ncbi:hypothetical protein MSMEG_1956 [Mycolicibacterium smegmatis MC2 155]|uniref:Uncharacterized protein n=1 Tax=Mycolicibacterium smegmatis (strain ATCC 700084 / mc(2)155) TaxID=246196 RepID=A0QTT3_MYCS2|nr:hypothetical protein MSMEG_1956 [Mycolicibacterium smegmatis MC2 155]